MEIISDSANILLNALVLGFAGALVLLAYVTLRPQASAFAAEDPVQEQPSLVEGNERIHQGTGRAAQPDKKGADRAA